MLVLISKVVLGLVCTLELSSTAAGGIIPALICGFALVLVRGFVLTVMPSGPLDVIVTGLAMTFTIPLLPGIELMVLVVPSPPFPTPEFEMIEVPRLLASTVRLAWLVTPPKVKVFPLSPLFPLPAFWSVGVPRTLASPVWLALLPSPPGLDILKPGSRVVPGPPTPCPKAKGGLTIMVVLTPAIPLGTNTVVIVTVPGRETHRPRIVPKILPTTTVVINTESMMIPAFVFHNVLLLPSTT